METSEVGGETGSQHTEGATETCLKMPTGERGAAF